MTHHRSQSLVSAGLFAALVDSFMHPSRRARVSEVRPKKAASFGGGRTGQKRGLAMAAVLVALLGVVLPPALGRPRLAHAAPPPGYTLTADAYGASVGVAGGLVSLAPVAEAVLPPGQTVSTVNLAVPGLVSASVITDSALDNSTGLQAVAAATSTVTNVDLPVLTLLNVLGGATNHVDAIQATASVTGTPTGSGGTTTSYAAASVANLTLLGARIAVTGQPNQTVTLLGLLGTPVASVVIDEQTFTTTAGITTGVTVTGVDITLLQAIPVLGLALGTHIILGRASSSLLYDPGPGATQTASAGQTQTASAGQTQTASANQTGTVTAGQTGTASAGQTGTAVAGQTATALANQTATTMANQTATMVANQTATTVANQTATTVANQTATTVANQTATTGAGQTQTSVAGQTQTSVAGQTQTSVAGQTQTSVAGQTQTSVAGQTQSAGQTQTAAAGPSQGASSPTSTPVTNGGGTPANQTATAAANQTSAAPSATAAANTGGPAASATAASATAASQPTTASGNPTYHPEIGVTPGAGQPGDTVTITGGGFAPGELVTIALNGAAVDASPSVVRTDAQGRLVARVTLPHGLLNGANTISAIGTTSRVAAMHALIGRLTVASRFFFAGGVNTRDTQSALQLLNPDARRVTATLTFYFTDGTTRSVTVALSAHRQVTLAVAPLVRRQGAFGVALTASRQIAAQLQLTRPGRDGDEILGNTGLGRTWYLAEGYTGLTFHQTVAVLNPDARRATRVALHLLPIGGRGARTVVLGVAPHSERVVDINALLPGRSLSIVATADRGVVVERSLTFSHLRSGRGSLSAYGLTTRAGTNVAATSWLFAEGSTLNRFETFLTVLNPGTRRVQVTARFYGRNAVLLRSVRLTLRPLSRANIRLNGLVQASGVASMVMSDQPIIVERPEYFGSPNGVRVAGSVVYGLNGAAPRWSFAGGRDHTTSEFLLFFNPSGAAVPVRLAFYDATGRVTTRRIMLAANARSSVDVGRAVPLLTALHGVTITSLNGQGFIAEQSVFTHSHTTLDSTQGFAQ